MSLIANLKQYVKQVNSMLEFTAKNTIHEYDEGNAHVIKYPSGKVIAYISKNFTNVVCGTQNGEWYRPANTLIIDLPKEMQSIPHENIKIYAINADVFPNQIWSAYDTGLNTLNQLRIWIYINTAITLQTVDLQVIVEANPNGGAVS